VSDGKECREIIEAANKIQSKEKKKKPRKHWKAHHFLLEEGYEKVVIFYFKNTGIGYMVNVLSTYCGFNLFIYCFSFLIRSFIPKDPPYMTTNNTKEKGNRLRPSVVATTNGILRPQRALCAKPGVRVALNKQEKRKRCQIWPQPSPRASTLSSASHAIR